MLLLQPSLRPFPPRRGNGLLPAASGIRSKQRAVSRIRRPGRRVLPPFAFGWALLDRKMLYVFLVRVV